MHQGTVHFTEEQAAERLHISLSTLRRWRKKGIGPVCFHFGDIIRYRDAELEAFVAKYSSNAA
jgi:predicted site-specific integrase-resolvase